MQTMGKADPAIYPKLREQALVSPRPAELAAGTPHVVLMDWMVGNGTTTVLAAADGSASIYLSSGGGFIGGGQGSPAIREASGKAIAIAARLISFSHPAHGHPLPGHGVVHFFFVSESGVSLAIAHEADLKSGADPMSPLGGAMQNIITQYRLWRENKP